MLPDTDTLIDPCPPVILPPGSSFPVTVDVPIQGLLLRDADDLARLNRLLADIRRLSRRPAPEPRERDPEVEEAVATYFWLDARIQAGEFADYPGQYVVAARKRVCGVAPEEEGVVEQAMKDDPTLGFQHFIAIRVPDPNDLSFLTR